MHHIVDPRTGDVAAPCWRTASVVAATCVDANIASTAAIVMGRAAPGWLAECGLPARLVAEDGTVTTSRLACGVAPREPGAVVRQPVVRAGHACCC